MSRFVTHTAAVVAAAAAVVAAPALLDAAADFDAQELVRQVETQYQGATSHAVMRMTITTASWTRELKLEAWGRGRDDFLARIMEPKKEAGIATLKVGDDIWNYLPKIDRVMQVPSSLMGEGWMGSHFTNDDLVRESRMADDYTFAVTFEGPRDGQSILEITLTPKPDAPVVWGKVVVEVTAQRIAVRIRYFNEKGELARTLRFSEVEQVGERKVPTVARMTPTEDGEYTEVRYLQWEFDVDVPEGRFSLRSLQR